MAQPIVLSGLVLGHGRLGRPPLVYAAVLCCAAVLLAPTAFGQGHYGDIGERVSRSVVKLESFDRRGQGISLGSGFVVSSQGLIVTNYHVIRNAYRVKATYANHDADDVDGVVDFDPEKDFAILKVTAFDLPVVELGNSNEVHNLDEVIAIGHPLGLTYTSSTGVISGRRQTENGFSMLQTTAPISPGNSGGPLVNLRGQVIGIVTEQMTQGQNLNFALPINYVRAALESNRSVQYTLEQIAQAQAKQNEAETEAEIARLFTVYEDKYKAYKALVPKPWKLANSEGWADDKQSYDIRAMVAPESATRAEVDDELSEGIRVTISLPPKGMEWTDTVAQYAASFTKAWLRGNPRYVQTSESSGSVGNEPVKILEFVGQDPGIQEPEKSRFYVFAKPQCTVSIECTSPASKFKDEDILFSVFMKSFKFNGCPAL